MTLAERIKSCRKEAGLSQEKVAEHLGISRQAVTRWESGQSAPNTENLFKLAELFGTTVDILLPKEETAPIPSPTEEAVQLILQARQKEKAERSFKIKRNIRNCVLVLAVYLLIYLIGRFIWCDFSESSFMGWLIFNIPKGENSYLYGWLLSSELFWWTMGISVIPSLFGKWKFSVYTVVGFVLGLILGIIFGPNPEGAAIGQSHYGWAIWGCIFLLSIPTGVIIEKLKK